MCGFLCINIPLKAREDIKCKLFHGVLGTVSRPFMCHPVYFLVISW